jgi:cupin fold WbuC family metalloprotein
MKLKRKTQNVFELPGEPGFVDSSAIRLLKQKADASPMKRARICLHNSSDDSIHEMLIVLSRGVYIRPHRHLGKSESFQLLEGRATVVFFDDKGNVTANRELARTSGKPFIYRINTPIFHTQIVHSKYLVFYEVTRGPWLPGETEYAAWAPEKAEEKLLRTWLQAGSKKPREGAKKLKSRS